MNRSSTTAASILAVPNARTVVSGYYPEHPLPRIYFTHIERNSTALNVHRVWWIPMFLPKKKNLFYLPPHTGVPAKSGLAVNHSSPFHHATASPVVVSILRPNTRHSPQMTMSTVHRLCSHLLNHTITWQQCYYSRPCVELLSDAAHLASMSSLSEIV